MSDRFHSFLGGNSNIVADEAFFNAVQSYYEVFIRSPRIARMVESGGATAADFRDVFKTQGGIFSIPLPFYMILYIALLSLRLEQYRQAYSQLARD